MQSIRDLFRTSLGRSLSSLSELDRLTAAWPVACGSALAAHAQVLALDADRVLHLEVSSSEWLQAFLSSRTALQNEVARIAAVRLTGIHFQVKGSRK